MDRRERIAVWSKSLTEDQMRNLIIDLVDYNIQSEIISFYDDCLAPYWDDSGEPLVEGQEIYPHEE